VNLRLHLSCKLSRLSNAVRQLLALGTLTQELYTGVVPIVEKAREEQSRLELGRKEDLDRRELLADISNHNRILNSCYEVIRPSDDEKSGRVQIMRRSLKKGTWTASRGA
jgi:hypothetical protein